MSEISKVSIIYPDGVSISTAGQYLENPFFQVPVGSTFAFLYDTNTTLSQAVLKQMYETILASQGGDMSGELRKAYEAAVKALNDMPGELAKCNADLASINAYENANVPALLASTIAILDTMESAITGLSDNLFSQTWKKTDIINDIGTIRSYLGTHYPNLNDDDFKDIFTRINGIRTIIAEVTRPDAGSDKYIELVFPLLGFDRSYIGSGDAGQSLLTIGEIREWIDGINGDPGILSPFISAFKAAMAVDKAINPAHITNFKSAIQAQMTMSYPWDANDRNGEGVTLTISGPYNIYTYQKTITVEYAGGYGTATRVYDVAEYYVRNADGSDGDRYEDLCNAIGLGDIAHTYNDSLLFEGIISSISSSPYANPIRTIQDDLIEIIFNRLNGDNSDEAKAAKLAILQAKDMPGASNYNLLSARKEKLFGFSSVLANLGTVETNVNSLKTNLSLADTIQKLKDKYYIPLNSTLDALKAAINAKIAGLDESKLQANVALAKAKVDEAMKGKAESLLQLALRYNPPSGQGFLVTGVSKTIDANGNATYKAKINGDTNEDGTISLAEAQAATVVTSKTKIDNVANHLSIPYFALAMCYEMTCVVKDMLLAQTEEIKEINGKIRNNNTFLRLANRLYEDTYKVSTQDIAPSNMDTGETGIGDNVEVTLDNYRVSNGIIKVYETIVPPGQREGTPLNDYLKTIGAKELTGTSMSETKDNGSTFKIGGDAYFNWGFYTSDGDCVVTKYENLADANAHIGTNSGHHDEDIFNIDVNEQGHLTQVSNAQEAIRMKGDELSTDVQMMNTKLTQYAQNFNSFLSVASQICKAVGDYFKSIASNVRF